MTTIKSIETSYASPIIRSEEPISSHDDIESKKDPQIAEMLESISSHDDIESKASLQTLDWISSIKKIDITKPIYKQFCAHEKLGDYINVIGILPGTPAIDKALVYFITTVKFDDDMQFVADSAARVLDNIYTDLTKQFPPNDICYQKVQTTHKILATFCMQVYVAFNECGRWEGVCSYYIDWLRQQIKELCTKMQISAFDISQVCNTIIELYKVQGNANFREIMTHQ